MCELGLNTKNDRFETRHGPTEIYCIETRTYRDLVACAPNLLLCFVSLSVRVALKLRSLRIHSPHLCGFAVFSVQTNVSLIIISINIINIMSILSVINIIISKPEPVPAHVPSLGVAVGLFCRGR